MPPIVRGQARGVPCAASRWSTIRGVASLQSCMGIDAQLRDEVGQILAEVGDPGGLLARAATRHALSGTVLLRYLMPWGDAVFNQAQAADLLRDLRSVRSEHEGRPLAAHLQSIEPLVERLQGEVHHYLWFVGD